MNRSRGFSLIEVLVSFAVVAVAVVVYLVAVNSYVAARDARYQSVAVRIAETKLGELRAAGYDTLPSSGSFNDSMLSNLPGGTGALAVTVYNTNTKKVEVTVTWTGASPYNRTVTLGTLITSDGLEH